MGLLGFGEDTKRKFTVDESKIFPITLEFTKPKKRGRPSKEDRKLYGVKHIILSDSEAFEDCKKAIDDYLVSL
jgi:hypothetical protein